MLSARLTKRCPSAHPLGVAKLAGYELRWHKVSEDGSGKCDVVPATVDDVVYGVVYEINAQEKTDLDQAEGLGSGYDQKDVAVILDGKVVTASIYFATKTKPTLKPYTWYKALVVAGAKEHGLPTDYIARLEAVEALEDPNHARHDCNMRIISATVQKDGNQM
jgi:cation transport regulator ChaC